MRIHHAVFGPSRGHAFLQCTTESLEETFRGLAWMTDLPQTVPAGVSWKPFFRLVVVEEAFLLIHTRPVDNATRSGMVLSRAAIIPVSQACDINDLRPIAEVLQTSWERNDTLAPIEVAQMLAPEEPKELLSLGVIISEGLVGNQQRPLVIVGQTGFDEAMFDLWERVPCSFRKQLSFGLSFGHDDVRDLSVVCTPPELASRWDSQQILDTSQTPSISIQTSALLGLPAAGSVSSFAQETEISLSSTAAVALAVRAAQLWNSGTRPTDWVNLLRILTERGGAGASALRIKSTAVDRLVASFDRWTAQDVLTLRNLDIEFIKNHEGVSDAISRWLTDNIAYINESHLYEIILSWTTHKPKPLWVNAVASALQSILSNSEDNQIKLVLVLWKVFAKVPDLCSRTLSLLNSAPTSETLLLRSAPTSVDILVADSLIPTVTSRGWWALGGVLLAQSRSPKDALDEAIKIRPESKQSRRVLYANALSYASDQVLVETAVMSKDETAISVAAEATIRSPATLSAFNWLDKAWFQLLDEAIRNSAEIVDALKDTASGLGQTVAAGIADAFVWRTIARSSLANLLEVPGRARAWALIPSPSLESIAVVTAQCWLNRYEDGTVSVQDLEPELAAAVRNVVTTRGYMTEVIRREPASLPRYFDDFPFSSEREAEFFLTELQSQTSALSESAAVAFGKSVREHSWSRIASRAAYALRNRPDFRPMVSECLDQLSFLDKLWVTFQLGVPLHLAEDDAWAALESEAVSMYPRGPHDRELWSRSGGRNEDLVFESTGRATWHRCLRDLRSGMLPGVEALIRAMLEDFAHSDTLRQLLRQRFWR